MTKNKNKLNNFDPESVIAIFEQNMEELRRKCDVYLVQGDLNQWEVNHNMLSSLFDICLELGAFSKPDSAEYQHILQDLVGAVSEQQAAYELYFINQADKLLYCKWQQALEDQRQYLAKWKAGDQK